ncbi:YceD family protein [Xanthobacter sp. TB0139]|uniref:YceD family protein n=1 Tax=Xanthobacter sp. TB0139 TaxID=3459178 RepID=UPI0040396CE4
MTETEHPTEQPAQDEAPLPLSKPVAITDIGPTGLNIRLVPDEAVRAELARYVNVLAVPSFLAQIHLEPEGKAGFHVTGEIKATVRQTCGVTLDEFDAPLLEEIDVHFVPEGTPRPPESEDDETYDPPDEILNGQIDVGALATEFLALGIEPYPRKPGAVFQQPDMDATGLSPFAALSRLKDPS